MSLLLAVAWCVVTVATAYIATAQWLWLEVTGR